MKFVFINPLRSFSGGNIWGMVNSIIPPIGLASLASLLESSGIGADIIDAGACRFTDKEILQQIDPHAQYVGFSATTPEIGSVLRLSGLVRKQFPRIPILFGGVHASVFHRELVESGACDLVIRGEGENPTLNLGRKADLKSIAGLTWRNPEGQTVVNPDNQDFVNLDDLPLPAYYKLPMHTYSSALGAARQEPSIGIITSRGCPGSCSFCCSGLFGKKTRMLSPENVLRHLEFLVREYGIREISFYDDTFTASRRRVMEICRLMLERQLKISWSCFARVDTVDAEVLHMMKLAGCHQIMYGFESADEEILRRIEKKTNLSSTLKATELTRAAGIDIRGAFMLGSPGETIETMERTVDLACQLPLKYAIFNITTPFPGTKLYQESKSKGFLESEDWDKYDLAHPVLKLPGLPPTQVLRAYQRAFRRFYLRPEYLWNMLLTARTRFETRRIVKTALGFLRSQLIRIMKRDTVENSRA